MRKLDKKTVNSLIVTFFLVLNLITIPLVMSTIFPDNKGFTRHVMFIHPTESTDGYYILIDEIHTKKSISFQFHSRGILEVGQSSATWVQDAIQMNCSFFGSQVDIITKLNYLYAGNNKEIHEYISVQPALETQYLITVIFFTNTTQGTPFNIIESQSGEIFTLSINSSDHFVLNKNPTSSARELWSFNKYQTDAKFYLYREGSLLPENFLVTSRATTFIKENTTLYNGISTPLVLANDTYNVGYFSGLPTSPEHSTPVDLSHYSSPGLYFTEEELPELRSKIAISGSQWETWYTQLSNKSILTLAFQGQIEENPDYIIQAEQILLNLKPFFNEEYANQQDIDKSTFLIDYILAYDMIYSNISAQNRAIIGEILHDLVAPLYIHHKQDVEYWNNHLVVSAIAFGLAGIVLNISEWVQETQRSIDYYLNGNGIRPNGACYEGAHYAYFTFKYASKFFYALQHIGGYNYFTHPRYQAFLNYTVQSMAPTGEAPVFEDCQVNRTMNIIASLAMSNVHDSNPILAENLKFLYDRTSPYEYEFVSQIILNYKNISSLSPYLTGRNQGFVYPTDGYACFRSGWNSSDYYLILSNKNFLQSHVHQDENSFELYAFGKKWITNPGYPSWGWEGHDYTISAEGSNTAIIDGRGQFSHIGDGFTSAVQHELVDYVESPTKTTYLHPAYPWNWMGFLIIYSILLIVVVVILVEFISSFRRIKKISLNESIHDDISISSQTYKLNKSLSYIHSFTSSLAIWMIGVPMLTKIWDFLKAHAELQIKYINIYIYGSYIFLVGIPCISYFCIFKRKSLSIYNQIQNIFFQMMINVGIAVIITPLVVTTFSKIVYDSGSNLLISLYLTQGITKLIPFIMGLVFLKLISVYLGVYIDPVTSKYQSSSKFFQKFCIITILILYGLVLFLSILYRT